MFKVSKIATKNFDLLKVSKVTTKNFNMFKVSEMTSVRSNHFKKQPSKEQSFEKVTSKKYNRYTYTKIIAIVKKFLLFFFRVYKYE